MKRIATLLIVVLSLAAHPAFAFNDQPPEERGAQICYGYAMVGFDSVINSRLGVPAEYALGLAVKKPLVANADPSYSTQVLKIALEAYMWPDSPHDYAVQVFYNCAKDQGRSLDTALD